MTSCTDATVDTSGIARPDVHDQRNGRLAIGSFDKLQLQVERDAWLPFSYIRTDVLAEDVVWSVGIVWCENAGGVGAKQD